MAPSASPEKETKKIRRICVYCGSSYGSRKEYRAAARELGIYLVENQIGLVFGGGRVGLMGETASIVKEKGGEVIGVIPAQLAKKDVAFTELDDLRIVETMHERKALMADLSDGFIAMPGGFGTIEEIFEALTWSQLGIHQKPCGFLNICGYFDGINSFLHLAVQEQFIFSAHRNMALIADTPEVLIAQMQNWKPPVVDKAKWALSQMNQ